MRTSAARTQSCGEARARTLVDRFGVWLSSRAIRKLHLAPVAEMNDHKMYYDPRDLWPLLVRAGFRPQDIKVKTHKFGLNTYGRCIKRQ